MNTAEALVIARRHMDKHRARPAPLTPEERTTMLSLHDSPTTSPMLYNLLSAGHIHRHKATPEALHTWKLTQQGKDALITIRCEEHTRG